MFKAIGIAVVTVAALAVSSPAQAHGHREVVIDPAVCHPQYCIQVRTVTTRHGVVLVQNRERPTNSRTSVRTGGPGWTEWKTFLR